MAHGRPGEGVHSVCGPGVMGVVWHDNWIWALMKTTRLPVSGTFPSWPAQ